MISHVVGSGADRPLDGSGRLLQTLESLLALPSAELRSTLVHACDLVSRAVRADKVDAFLYDAERSSLVALGTSDQPMSRLQRQLGLDVLPLANGGRVVLVYRTGETFTSGELDRDHEELRGIRESLRVRSMVAVALQVGGERRGVLAVASGEPSFFSPEDVRFTELVARWVGMVVHRAELVAHIERNALERGRRAVAEELITVIAHDLRNFISPIGLRLANIAMRAEEAGRDHDVEESRLAAAGLDRLTRMIENILDYARIDRGIFQMDRRPVELVPLGRELAQLLSTSARPIQLRASREVVVEGDRERLSQCLENILSNALKHSPPQVPVVLTIEPEPRPAGPWAKVVVCDDGPGIPPDVLPVIFERFITGEGSRGLGLGLYLARQIALAHGGELTVESSPGRGSRFVLALPLLRPVPVVAGLAKER